jgi:hypothetical protein
MTDSRASETATVPFWERLRAILAYPLQTEALLTISLLAGLRLFSILPGVGWILNLLITVAILRYAAEVLVVSANGSTDAPSGYSTPDEVGWVVLKVQILLAVMAVVLGMVGVAVGLGWAALLIPVAIGLGTPAALMYAAIDEDALGAINPAMWLQTFLRIGWPYLGAALLCVVIMYSEANAKSFTVPFLPMPLAIVVHYFISHYATVVTFHLLGYLVYQYRNELGFEVAAKPKPLARARDRDQSVLDESEALAANGNTQGAASVLGEHIAERGGTDAVHGRYRKLLTLHNDAAALEKHSREYLNVLIAHERWPRALEFWTECRNTQPGLWPSDPSQVLELIEKANELGKPELAMKFANGFSRQYPTHGTVPAVHLAVAKVLALFMNKREEARKLLEDTRAAYPRSKTVPAIDEYLATL